MDITTIFGIIILVIVLISGYITGQLPKILFNFHAFLLVIGGTITATMLNTPKRYIIKSIKMANLIFFQSEEENPEKLIPYIVELAENARKSGLKVFRDVDEKIADGFLKRVADAALEYSDAQFVRKIIEQEINQNFDEINEVSNVYRTMSILSPMFGLIGTLIGIIDVLKELSNPESVGPAMAIAITSAFYGIFLANLIFVPFAGKIRTRALMQLKLKAMILEGIMEIMKGSIPIMVERRLKSFIE